MHLLGVVAGNTCRRQIFNNLIILVENKAIGPEVNYQIVDNFSSSVLHFSMRGTLGVIIGIRS